MALSFACPPLNSFPIAAKYTRIRMYVHVPFVKCVFAVYTCVCYTWVIYILFVIYMICVAYMYGMCDTYM